MKRKIRKILGLGLTIMMVLSLMMFFAPAATAADWDENEWSSWGLPDTDSDTDIGPMAIAPDGTIYKSVWDVDEDELRVDKSEDNGKQKMAAIRQGTRPSQGQVRPPLVSRRRRHLRRGNLKIPTANNLEIAASSGSTAFILRRYLVSKSLTVKGVPGDDS